jgi:hypothetical protein
MLAALSLLMRHILGIAKASIADQQMVGKRIGFLGRQ